MGRAPVGRVSQWEASNRGQLWAEISNEGHLWAGLPNGNQWRTWAGPTNEGP